MSEPLRSSTRAGATSSLGPTLSFGFNLGKIPDQGEDADPILRDGRDLALVGVLDGMGGAGGTVYDTPDGKRTGAYIASRVARDVVEARMLDLLQPDWNLNGRAAAEDLRRSVRDALVQRLEDLDAPKSGLRSKLLRALPTTMALLALQRTQPGGERWACHAFWAGDSRAYVLDPEGIRQLTTDDLREPSDAMTNLRHDSVVSNAMSADTDFEVSHRRVELQAPFVVLAATDGCFGYVRSPMHFEHLLLSTLRDAATPDAWSDALQERIAAVTGDDAAMSLLSVGADFTELQALFADRVALLEQTFTAPLDEAATAVEEAERSLEALRQREREVTADVWGRYKPGYERHLHPQPVQGAPEDEPSPEDAAADGVPDDDRPGSAETSGEGSPA